ncbi:target of EGR1 protein 1 [Tetranychus urticae]|uniref:C3H1-type domain-containing protein n=1 Tax=Tetranychus urticae TaxID=32264 RepID=T1KNK8_TETUR|nr:target of EGR1 protein 1 [Tetranychus urticae]
MEQLDRVPCIQVNSTNIIACWPHLMKAIEQSHFLAIDLELSGLGDKKKLILKDIEERYKAIGEVAKTRSILSVGLSFFRYNRKLINGSDQTDWRNKDEFCDWNFKVINFELLTLCNEESVLEDESRSFLVSHGFDFDAQTSIGLQYLRADQELNPDVPSIRNLFHQLVNKKVPLVLHNGLLDLIFIYHNFLANLPPKLPTFVADLDKLFPKGIFDTKYVAEHNFKSKGSYLEYLFYQRQRRNLERRVANKPFISISFGSDDSIRDFVVERSMKSIILGDKPEGLKICDDYRQHGWCKKGASCQKSHDIDFILDDEDFYKEPSKTRKRILAKMNLINSPKNDVEMGEVGDSIEIKEHINGQVKSGIHRSGYDAFMTGYCFATFINELSKQKPGKSGKLNFSTSEMLKLNNKIFLTGKKDPLQIRYSQYSKPSSNISKLITETMSPEITKECGIIDPEKVDGSNSVTSEESKSLNSSGISDCDLIVTSETDEISDSLDGTNGTESIDEEQ